MNNGNIIYDELITRGGHFYVCGDVSMAHDVQMTLKTILQEHGKMDEKSASDLVIKLRVGQVFSDNLVDFDHFLER